MRRHSEPDRGAERDVPLAGRRRRDVYVREPRGGSASRIPSRGSRRKGSAVRSSPGRRKGGILQSHIGGVRPGRTLPDAGDAREGAERRRPVVLRERGSPVRRRRKAVRLSWNGYGRYRPEAGGSGREGAARDRRRHRERQDAGRGRRNRPEGTRRTDGYAEFPRRGVRRSRENPPNPAGPESRRKGASGVLVRREIADRDGHPERAGDAVHEGGYPEARRRRDHRPRRSARRGVARRSDAEQRQRLRRRHPAELRRSGGVRRCRPRDPPGRREPAQRLYRKDAGRNRGVRGEAAAEGYHRLSAGRDAGRRQGETRDHLEPGDGGDDGNPGF